MNIQELIEQAQGVSSLKIIIEKYGLTLMMKKPPAYKIESWFKKYITLSMTMNNSDKDEEKQGKLTADFFGLGIALCEFVTGWEGADDEFSKQKLISFMSLYPDVAKEFGQGFRESWEEYQKNALLEKKVLKTT